MYYQLACHPDTPAANVAQVRVLLQAEQRLLRLAFEVSPARHLLVPERRAPERTGGLWKSTCFELFVRPAGGTGYLEFNFAPSLQWAAYGFDDYRAGMTDLAADDPGITVSRSATDFVLAVEAMPALPSTALEIGLSAVIEETGGTKSYWALAHPTGKPDFHHPDCFVLELPAPPHP